MLEVVEDDIVFDANDEDDVALLAHIMKRKSQRRRAQTTVTSSPRKDRFKHLAIDDDPKSLAEHHNGTGPQLEVKTASLYCEPLPAPRHLVSDDNAGAGSRLHSQSSLQVVSGPSPPIEDVSKHPAKAHTSKVRKVKAAGGIPVVTEDVFGRDLNVVQPVGPTATQAGAPAQQAAAGVDVLPQKPATPRLKRSSTMTSRQSNSANNRQVAPSVEGIRKARSLCLRHSNSIPVDVQKTEVAAVVSPVTELSSQPPASQHEQAAVALRIEQSANDGDLYIRLNSDSEGSTRNDTNSIQFEVMTEGRVSIGSSFVIQPTSAAVKSLSTNASFTKASSLDHALDRGAGGSSSHGVVMPSALKRIDADSGDDDDIEFVSIGTTPRASRSHSPQCRPLADSLPAVTACNQSEAVLGSSAPISKSWAIRSQQQRVAPSIPSRANGTKEEPRRVTRNIVPRCAFVAPRGSSPSPSKRNPTNNENKVHRAGTANGGRAKVSPSCPKGAVLPQTSRPTTVSPSLSRPSQGKAAPQQGGVGSSQSPAVTLHRYTNSAPRTQSPQEAPQRAATASRAQSPLVHDKRGGGRTASPPKFVAGTVARDKAFPATISPVRRTCPPQYRNCVSVVAQYVRQPTVINLNRKPPAVEVPPPPKPITRPVAVFVTSKSAPASATVQQRQSSVAALIDDEGRQRESIVTRCSSVWQILFDLFSQEKREVFYSVRNRIQLEERRRREQLLLHEADHRFVMLSIPFWEERIEVCFPRARIAGDEAHQRLSLLIWHFASLCYLRKQIYQQNMLHNIAGCILLPMCLEMEGEARALIMQKEEQAWEVHPFWLKCMKALERTVFGAEAREWAKLSRLGAARLERRGVVGEMHWGEGHEVDGD